MNGRYLAIFVPLAATVIVFQWWQNTQIRTNESDLRAELAQLKVLRAQAPAASASPSAASKRPAPAAAAAFDPDQFVSDLSALAPLVNNKTPEGNPVDMDALQQQALAIMGQIATAPPALLKQAYEKLMTSSLPDQMKGELSQPMLLRLAETEPAWAVSQGAKISNNDFVLHSLLKTWAARDAPAAKAWLEKAALDGSLAGFGSGVVERLNSGIAADQASIQSWTRADYNGAATWLRDLPASPNRDTAVAAFAQLVAEKEPPSAVDWAVTIKDPEQRTKTLGQVWTGWKARALDEATAYFQQKGLAIPE